MKKLGCSYTFPDLIFKGLAYFYDFIVSSLFPPPLSCILATGQTALAA